MDDDLTTRSALEGASAAAASRSREVAPLHARIIMALKDIRTEARTAQQDLIHADDEEVNGHLNIIMRIVDRALVDLHAAAIEAPISADDEDHP